MKSPTLSPVALRTKLRHAGFQIPPDLDREASRLVEKKRRDRVDLRNARKLAELQPKVEAMAAGVSMAAADLVAGHDAPKKSKSALLAVIDRALVKYLQDRFKTNTGKAGEVRV